MNRQELIDTLNVISVTNELADLRRQNEALWAFVSTLRELEIAINMGNPGIIVIATTNMKNAHAALNEWQEVGGE